MLIREDLATELAVATRVLAHAGALAAEARITVRAGEVFYVAGRSAQKATLTPYDVIAVRIADGDVLRGDAPQDVERYLAAHRREPEIASAVAIGDEVLTAASLRACAIAALARARPDLGEGEEAWGRALGNAKTAGALIGIEP